MRMRACWAACGFLLLILSSCASNKGTGPKPDQITGTWNATKDEYVSQSSPAAVDLIALGGSATLVLNSDGSFEFTCTPAGEPSAVTTGTWTMTTDLFRATPTGMSWSWEWDATLAGGAFTLTGATAEYDCNDDGTPESATWNLTFVR
jgi:hypothetical protein